LNFVVDKPRTRNINIKEGLKVNGKDIIHDVVIQKDGNAVFIVI
jgi:hypothetical protein